MLEPMRRCDETKFLPKAENVYTVHNVETGEIRKANGELFKTLKEQGFEKIYKYRKGNEWRELTVTGAVEWSGYTRHSKVAVQETRYLANGWNEPSMFEKWRADIAARVNEALKRAGMDARVDHRNYARQGIDRVPQVHEGSRAHMVELKEKKRAAEKGYEYQPVTDVHQKNVDISKLNKEISALETLEMTIEEMKRRG